MRRMSQWITAVACCSILIGCLAGDKKLDYLGEAPLQYYRDVVRQIDYPDIHEPTDERVTFTQEPRRIRHLSEAEDEIWDMTLNEALRTALLNADIVRTSGAFLATQGNMLMTNPDGVDSVYDPAIGDTVVQLGRRGVEAALADFDARFSTSMTWSRTEQVSESTTIGFGGLFRWCHSASYCRLFSGSLRTS